MLNKVLVVFLAMCVTYIAYLRVSVTDLENKYANVVAKEAHCSAELGNLKSRALIEKTIGVIPDISLGDWMRDKGYLRD